MKMAAISLCISFVLLGCACDATPASSTGPSPTSTTVVAASSAGFGKEVSTGATNTPNPAAAATATDTSINPPAQTPKPAQTAGSAATSSPVQTPQSGQTPVATPSSKSKLYDPSIFVIQADGKWRKELAPNYFADYEADLYLHKIDPNDNRVVTGSYQGVFWMKVTIDADEYIKDMLKNAPVQMDFAAGGEAICDNLGINLNTTDDKAWVDYTILDDNGDPLPLTQDTPVAKGSFVTVAKDVYLKAKARGAQGERVDYETEAGTGDLTDANYIIHVQPDSMESGTQRKVVIYLETPGADPMIMNGTLRRLPGYPEDVSDYLNSDEYQQAARKHLDD